MVSSLKTKGDVLMKMIKNGGVMIKIVSLSALLLLSACSEMGVVDQAREATNTSFYQHWVHSFEEQNGDKVRHIFRPAGSRQFPPSRFRMEFGFDPNGQCNYKFLSPTDRHQMRNCVYTKIGNEIFLYDDQGKALSHLNFTIRSASQDKLEMSYGVKKPVVKAKRKS